MTEWPPNGTYVIIHLGRRSQPIPIGADERQVRQALLDSGMDAERALADIWADETEISAVYEIVPLAEILPRRRVKYLMTTKPRQPESDA